MSALLSRTSYLDLVRFVANAISESISVGGKNKRWFMNSRRCRRTCIGCICAQCIGCGAQIALQIARHGRLPGWRVRRAQPGSDLQRSTEYRRRQLQVDEDAQGLEIHIEEDLQLAPGVCPREPIGRPRSAIIGTASRKIARPIGCLVRSRRDPRSASRSSAKVPEASGAVLPGAAGCSGSGRACGSGALSVAMISSKR